MAERALDAKWLVAGASVAATGGLIVSLHTAAAVILLAALGTGIAIRSLRLSSFDLLIILLPVSVYSSVAGTAVNFFPAVGAVGFVLVQNVLVTQRRELAIPGASPGKAFTAWAAILLTLSAGSLIVASLTLTSMDYVYGLLGVVKVLSAIALLGGVWWSVRLGGKQTLLRAFKVWTWTALVLALVTATAFLQSSSGANNVVTDLTIEAFRAKGLFEDPNAYAAYLLMSMGVALAWWAHDKSVVAIASTPLFMLSLFATGSRAALPALLVSVLVVLASLGAGTFTKRLLAWLSLAAAGSLLTVWLIRSENQAVERVLAGSEVAASGDPRFLAWSLALDAWSASPLIGVGLGQFREFVGLSFIPHSTYLTFLAETGIIGLLAWLFLPWRTGKSLWRLHRRGELMASALVGALIAVGVQAFTINLENQPALWALIGLSAGLTTLSSAPLGAPEVEALRKDADCGRTSNQDKA